MAIQGAVSQHPTFPSHPQPEQPARAAAQPPMVYVHERQEWEYRVLVRSAAERHGPSEDELNRLGSDGWELAGIASLGGAVQFYFKRIRR